MSITSDSQHLKVGAAAFGNFLLKQHAFSLKIIRQRRRHDEILFGNSERACKLVEYHCITASGIFPWQIGELINIKKSYLRYIERIFCEDLRYYFMHAHGCLPG